MWETTDAINQDLGWSMLPYKWFMTILILTMVYSWDCHIYQRTNQLSNQLTTCLFIYLSIYPSIYLSAIIYLSIHPSIYVYVGKWLSCWLTPVCRVYHIYLFVYLSTVYICNASSAICTCIYWASIDLWLCTVWCMCTTKCNYLWTEYLVFIYITLQ